MTNMVFLGTRNPLFTVFKARRNRIYAYRPDSFTAVMPNAKSPDAAAGGGAYT